MERGDSWLKEFLADELDARKKWNSNQTARSHKRRSRSRHDGPRSLVPTRPPVNRKGGRRAASNGMEEGEEQRRGGRPRRKDDIQMLTEFNFSTDDALSFDRHAMALAEADMSSSSFGSSHMFNMDDLVSDAEMRKMHVAARKKENEPPCEETSHRSAGQTIQFPDIPHLSYPRFKIGRLVGAPPQAMAMEESKHSCSSVESSGMFEVDDLVTEEEARKMEMQEELRRKKETGELSWEESADCRAWSKRKGNEERKEPEDSSSEDSVGNICDEDI